MRVHQVRLTLKKKTEILTQFNPYFFVLISHLWRDDFKTLNLQYRFVES